MPKVSIIVPVYNAEKYLSRCIDSILAQTFTDFEALLIDDGSTDESSRMCDKYADRDLRVHIFHKENGGVSSARNMGIEMASGEYIGWVDADDWIEKDMFEQMYKKAKEEEADMVFCDYKLVGLSYRGGRYDKLVSSAQSERGKDTLMKAIVTEEISGALWYKLSKKTLFTDNKIQFINGADMMEDVACSVQLIHYAQKISHIPKCLYNYNRYNENSIIACTKKKQICKRVNDSFLNIDSIQDIINDNFDIQRELRHRRLMALAPYLETDDSDLRKMWRSKCKVSVIQIAMDSYFSIGYRFKYICVKMGLFHLYNIYVKIKYRNN